MALHTLVGGLTGGLGGALGAGASSMSVPYIAAAINSSDLPDAARAGLIATASTALGATVGGGYPGAVTAFNEVINNCLAHECLTIKWDKNAPGYHSYNAVPSGILCTAVEPGCMDAAKRVLACSSAPGQSGCSTPGQTTPWSLTLGNQITQYLSPNGQVIINGTTDGQHMLDDGYVMRWIGVDSQGAVRIYTYGEGVNKSWYGIPASVMADFNATMGRGIFTNLGAQNQIEVRNTLSNQSR